MTGTDVAVRSQAEAIPAKLAYAKALAESGLLPSAYRKQPANVLWAVEYGDMLGLAPLAAITGVHVIDGKPTASAGLISALVRRAGHKLRVSGDAEEATCQIVRSDDPGYTFAVTFTAKDAQAAGLLSKDVWKKYRPSMLKARAITQCARDACEEALFGLHYTAEELGANVDEDGVVIAEVVGEPDEAAASSRDITVQFLNDADAFTTDEAAAKICRAADAARRQGRINRDQCDRIQHSVRIRLEALRRDAQPVNVEDLARQAAAGEPEPSGSDRHRKLVGHVQGHFKRLGFSDEDKAERLWAAGKLAKVKFDAESLNAFDEVELATIADALARCKDRERLEAMLAAAGDDGA